VQPEIFSLDQNYPNPFNPATNIHYAVPVASHIKITVYDLLGHTIRHLVDQDMAPGDYSMTWRGRNDLGEIVGSGLYIYRLISGQFVRTRKMMLIK